MVIKQNSLEAVIEVVGLDQHSCATSDPVSTGIGDRLWTGNHLGM